MKRLTFLHIIILLTCHSTISAGNTEHDAGNSCGCDFVNPPEALHVEPWQKALLNGKVYRPLVEDGKVWTYEASNPEAENYREWEDIYSLEGDTVIDSRQCWKLYITSGSPYIPYDHAYHGALYEESGRVYYYAPDEVSSTLLYDFKCKPDDIVRIYDHFDAFTGWYDMLVQAKKYINYRGKELTVIDWDPVLLEHDIVIRDIPGSVWIEGIGSPIDFMNATPTWNTDGLSKQLLRCELNGEVVYEREDFNEHSFPVPAKETDRRYFRQGTMWTEIRLDTLKHDSWYSRAGDEWVPNFETVEYWVEPCKKYPSSVWCNGDDYILSYDIHTAGPTWSDSLAFRLYETHTPDDVCVSILTGHSLVAAYQFNWFVGKELYYQKAFYTISTTKHYFGTIADIGEDNFGGESPQRYVDLNGVRIIQGIGVTEWNDGDCLFGPLELYRDKFRTGPERHYRSMLVHFECNDEVLYEAWPEKVGTGIRDEMREQTETSAIYDLQGRRLPAAHSRGIYIFGGRKVVK